jgi:hypothetical protein
MKNAPPIPAEYRPNLVGAGTFSLDRLLSHVDPGPPKVSEDLVRKIYEQRRHDASSDCDRQTGG